MLAIILTYQMYNFYIFLHHRFSMGEASLSNTSTHVRISINLHHNICIII